MSWDKCVEGFVRDYPDQEKSLLRAIKYWQKYSSKDMGSVKRIDVYNFSGDSFREFLKGEIKSDSGKNKILFMMDRFYTYWIMRMRSEDESFSFVSPFDFRFDKFKITAKYSTYREVIPKEIIETMKEVLTENNFEFGRKFDEDYIGDTWSPSTTIFLYTMLSIPIRGIQGLLLDSGLGDEYIYDFKLKDMVRNLGGEKGRQEGFVRMSHYSGWTTQKKESLWITTNKSMHQGYEMNWVSEDLIKVIQYQLEFLIKYPLGEKRSKTVLVGGSEGNNSKFHFLFRDVTFEDGINPVSRVKVYKLWKKLCLEVQARTGFQLVAKGKSLFGLHNIRVSLISYALDMGLDLSLVSRAVAGHSTLGMTLYYYKSDKLRDRLKMVEGSKGVTSIESLKLLGGKSESK